MRVISLRDLISNPASGRLSTSDSIVLMAFLVSAFVLVWTTVKNAEAPTELYIAFLGAWVAQSQASKHMSIRRAKEVPGVVSNPETPQK